VTVPLPKLRDNDVLIKVKACGVCGTDLHIHEGEFIGRHGKEAGLVDTAETWCSEVPFDPRTRDGGSGGGGGKGCQGL
jgi:hypothetical protein